MEIHIRAKNATPDLSPDLAELANSLAEDVAHQIARYASPPSKGEKDGGLLVGIAILSATLTAISTTINVLNFWASRHKTEKTVAIIDGDYTILLGNLSEPDQQRLVDKIHKRDQVEIVLSSIKS